MKLKQEILELLTKWCDKLISYTVDFDDPYLHGALLCPACTIVHGRIGDLAFPLMLLYRESGDVKYYEAAKKYVAWTERNLSREDGCIYNDVGSTWKGISAFSALAIGESLHYFSELMDEETRSSWEALFKRLIYACAKHFENPYFRSNINYFAGAAALFIFGYNYFKDEYLLEKSKMWEEKCHDFFDEQGLFYGEGKKKTERTAKGCRPIDMGYNIEESIPLLLMHAIWSKNDTLIEYYKEKAKAHLHFVLPDGAIDNSFGTRHNKWTYWGSRTSDGLQEGYILIAKDEPMIARACLESFRLFKRCTHDGLLNQGLMSHTAGEPACVHHSFTHAKALAAFYLHIDEDDFKDCEATPMPREIEGVASFQNGNVYTVTRGGFIATVNADDDVEYPDADNGGGCISLLYHKSYGPILASTLHTYVPTEPLNMQYQRHADKVVCQTPRFISGGYTSDNDRSVKLTQSDFRFTAESEEFPLTVTYDFTENGVNVTVLSEKDGTYRLPVISSSEDSYTESSGSVTFRDTLTVSTDGKLDITLYHGKRFFNQVGGFQYVDVDFPVEASKELKFSICVK